MSLAGGAVVSSIHYGTATDGTDENYASLTTIATGVNGTSLMVAARDGGGDLIRGCTGLASEGRSCPNLEFNVKNNGDVAQTRTADGLTKSAVYATCRDDDPVIYRSFNQVNGITPTITGGNDHGECIIDFKFPVKDRFVYATGFISTGNSSNIVNCGFVVNENILNCIVRDGSSNNQVDGDIMVVIH